MTSDISMDHRSVLGSNLPLDDVPVGVVQVCTGTMHVHTVGFVQVLCMYRLWEGNSH